MLLKWIIRSEERHHGGSGNGSTNKAEQVDLGAVFYVGNDSAKVVQLSPRCTVYVLRQQRGVYDVVGFLDDVSALHHFARSASDYSGCMFVGTNQTWCDLCDDRIETQGSRCFLHRCA